MIQGPRLLELWTRYRDAFGCSLPLGLPMAFTDPVPRPLEEIVGRYARTHGPFLTADVANRFAAPPERIAGALAALEGDERLVVGEFRPEGVSREFCDVDVLRRLRRRSLAALRREVEPVEQAIAPHSSSGSVLAACSGVRSHAQLGLMATRSPGRTKAPIPPNAASAWRTLAVGPPPQAVARAPGASGSIR